MSSFRELLKNKDIVEHIFQYLHLEEQIKCLNVCKLWRRVIVKSLWMKKFRYLNVFKTPYVTIITNTRSDRSNTEIIDRKLEKLIEYKTALKGDECNIFLEEVAPVVRNLRLYSEYLSYQQKLGVSFQNVQLFCNLRYICYKRLIVSNGQLKLLVSSCMQLQKLEFIECTCRQLSVLIPGINLAIEHLEKLPFLRELVVQCEEDTVQPEIECTTLHRTLSKLRLRTLILKNFKIIDNGADTVRITHGDSVMVLNVGIISLDFWPDFKHHLKDFSNLIDLTINVLNCNTVVNSSVLELVALRCKKLQRLSLENCDFFVEDFSVMKSLRHLSLLNCGGFTADNLQQVLGELSLISFSLHHTRILGTVIDIRISATLQELEINTIYFNEISDILQMSVGPMENLLILKWLNGNVNDDWINDKCPNLRVLHIPNYQMIRHKILKMSTLRELSFSSCKGFSWRFFLLLIRNLTLKSFSLRTFDIIEDGSDVPTHAYGIHSTLESIFIPHHIFKTAQEFWMDLLALNRQMRIIFYGEYWDMFSPMFLRSLLRYPVMENSLKQFRICGFLVDIEDLKNAWDDTLHDLNMKISHYRSRNLKITMEL
ncbi:uncharacterized protein [Musca autumnalis]|uniref:uncharacterized protein n=1 Tax=Musca autumnalis TaxID=221902 RepID=UPI003CFA770F